MGPASREEWDTEVRRELTRLILPATVVSGTLFIWITELAGWPPDVILLGPALILLSFAVWALLDHSFRVARWLLVLGILGVCLSTVVFLPPTTAGALLVLPTGLAALSLGSRAGLLVAALASVIVLAGDRLLSLAESPADGAALPLIWGIAALGWIFTRRTERMVEPLRASYEETHTLLVEARGQRVELKQVQEDLVQANIQLARLSERLTNMYQVAEAARRIKEEFVANVSHELRTPLNMVIGFSEMITQAPHAYGVELPTTLLADVAVIQRNSEHLARLVDDVLDLAQMEAGQMAVSKEWVSLREIVEAAVVAVEPLFQSRGLNLGVDVPEDLPLVFGDRTRIRQVVLNLLSNAGRFTEQGGARVRVRKEGAELITSIADSGPGISPENQTHIFEPFHQADGSIRRRFGGTGLGLSISRRFIELHGGRMWLESQPGAGSTFFFSLPLQAAPSDPEGETRWLAAVKPYEPRTRPWKAPAPRLLPRFVVLESGDVLQRLLRRYLGDAEVTSVSTVDQAVEEVRRLPAQALIVNDPALEHAGERLHRAASLPYQTLTITCWVPGEQEAAERLGVVRYLVKPVSREALLAALDALGRPIRTVLVVDDEPEVVQLFGRVLTSAGRGYRVLRAVDGERALALLRERQPDVVLLDLLMPGLDGHTVLREKSLDPRTHDIPVVAVSAQDPVGDSVVSNLLTVTQSGGLSLRDLLTCIQTLSETLAPARRSGDRAHPGDRSG
ncbi:MAG: response regulator [Chloroflexi bacterium]|nr:response regulator [Chloroflexota bacterium]